MVEVDDVSVHFETPDVAAKSVSLTSFGRFADNKQARGVPSPTGLWYRRRSDEMVEDASVNTKASCSSGKLTMREALAAATALTDGKMDKVRRLRVERWHGGLCRVRSRC